LATLATLTFVISSGKVLLIRKKRGFGAGKVNGVGGKVEEGEPLEEAARREVLEEVGLTVRNVHHRGVLHFYSSDHVPDWVVHVFVADSYEGEVSGSDEAEPLWVPLGSIPFSEMWEDDRHWLPHVLSGYNVEGHFYFDGDYSRLIRFNLKVF